MWGPKTPVEPPEDWLEYPIFYLLYIAFLCYILTDKNKWW